MSKIQITLSNEVYNFLNENKMVSNKIRNFQKKYNVNNHRNLLETLLGRKNTLREDANNSGEEQNISREDVLNKLANNDFESHNPTSFKTALEKSKHLLMLTPYEVSDLNKMRLFKLNGYNIGYALKRRDDDNGNPISPNYNELVAVFNNEPSIKKIGDVLVQNAINNGACFADHFDGHLTPFYKALGFVEYKRVAYDPQYDPDGSFRKLYGESDIVYIVHKNCKK